MSDSDAEPFMDSYQRLERAARALGPTDEHRTAKLREFQQMANLLLLALVSSAAGKGPYGYGGGDSPAAQQTLHRFLLDRLPRLSPGDALGLACYRAMQALVSELGRGRHES